MSMLLVPATIPVTDDDSSRLTAAMGAFELHMSTFPHDCMPTVMEGLIPGRDFVRPDNATEPLHVLHPDWLVSHAVRRAYETCAERGLNPRFDFRITSLGDQAFESFALSVHRPHDSRILCGRISAQPLLQEAVGVTRQVIAHGYMPTLKIVFFGDNPDDLSYRVQIKRAAAMVGIGIDEMGLPAKPDGHELRSVLHQLNQDPLVDAVLVQTIRDKELNHIIRQTLSVNKDPENVTLRHMGEVMTSTAEDVIRAPSTAMSILALLKEALGPLQGKYIVLLNDTPVIGRPLHSLLSNERAAFTSVNRFFAEEKKARTIKDADAIVTATGVIDIVKPADVTPGVVIIDAAIKREGNRIRGDITIDAMLPYVSKITPVPGGVGPRTVAELLRSTAYLAKAHHHRLCPRQPATG